MVFNSLSFLVFFAISVGLYLLPLPWTVKKINLLIASYLFYAAWSPPFVLLLMSSAIIDFVLAHLIGNSQSPALRKLLLVLSLSINLGLLAVFKYGGFLLENVNAVLGVFDFRYPLPLPSLVLPLGISFYTFETVSYLIDVYRNRIKPCQSFLDYALFLTFFPHLVAGPIVRAADFLPQCTVPRRPSWGEFGWGVFLMMLGMVEKIVFADLLLARTADKVYSIHGPVNTAEAWIGTLAFAGQIFFDFAGYSTCGIGAALCLGFKLKRNFHFPYAAVGFSDFWRRWHISLSTWLRDYLYIPLGGSRGSQPVVYRNLMVTMLLGGLWHGASWQFVIWGGLHGSYLLCERVLRELCGDWRIVQHALFRAAMAMVTFVFVMFAWAYFRALSLESANQVVSAMWGLTRTTTSVLGRHHYYCVLPVVGGLLVTHWLLRDTTLEEVAARLPSFALALIGAALRCCSF